MSSLCTVCNSYPCPGCTGAAVDEVVRTRSKLRAVRGIVSELQAKWYSEEGRASLALIAAELDRDESATKPERPTCARCGRRLSLDPNGTGMASGLGGACPRGGTCGPLNGVSIDARDYRDV